MKTLLILAILFTIWTRTNAAKSSDVADLLRELGLPSSKETVLKQDESINDDDDDYDDDGALAKVMTNALFSTLMEEGEDGEDSIMANIMKSDKEQAAAQFGFATRLIGRFAGGLLKRRLCRG